MLSLATRHRTLLTGGISTNVTAKAHMFTILKERGDKPKVAPAAPAPQLIRPHETLNWDEDRKDFRYESKQLITDQFQEKIRDARTDSRNRRERNYMHVASIPTIFVDKWIREGFDILTDRNITYADIEKKLKAENLGHFIATSKRF